MGSADDFLAYYVMGTDGMRAFGSGGVVNTDDNLHLEFSAPLSMDVPTQGKNAQALYRFRESLLPYLLPEKSDSARSAQIRKWDRYLQAGVAYSPAHVLFLRGGYDTPEFQGIMKELDRRYPAYAPAAFLKGEVQELVAMNPTLIRAERFVLLDEKGEKGVVEISAVKAGVGKERAAVIFVDNRTRTIYGQLYIDAPSEILEGKIGRFSDEVMSDLVTASRMQLHDGASDGKNYPHKPVLLETFRKIISSKIRTYSDSGGAKGK
jgi:spermidine synthase